MTVKAVRSREVRDFSGETIAVFSAKDFVGQEKAKIQDEKSEALFKLSSFLLDVARERSGEMRMFPSLSFNAFTASGDNADEWVRAAKWEHEANISEIQYAINTDAEHSILSVITCRYRLNDKSAKFAVVMETIDHIDGRIEASMLHGDLEIGFHETKEAKVLLEAGKNITILRIVPVMEE